MINKLARETNSDFHLRSWTATMLDYEKLIEQYYPRMRICARQVIAGYPSVRRWEQTDDVVQLSMMRLLKAIEAASPKTELHFYRLASLQVRRMVIDLARSLSGPFGIAANHETHQGLAPPCEQFVDEATSDAAALSMLQWEQLHSLVDQLESNDREMFDLVWYAGLDKHRISELLRITNRSVQRRWRRARISLSELHQAREESVQ